VTQAGSPVATELIERVLAGERRAVARLISLIENGADGVEEALARLYPATGNAYTVGITGASGSGKSTLTDRLVAAFRAGGSEVGVIAIDPSSPFTGGAILGDRVRMQGHATDRGVFIRSMATRGHLGGLALATPQAIRVLDAAGKPWIFVETVGVGQSEVEVVEATDTTVVVVNPGWGDSVQANKAGLLEIGEIFVVNKADRPGTREAMRDLEQMLEFGHRGAGWRPPVLAAVAAEGTGTAELREAILAHRRHLEEGGGLAAERRRRAADEVRRIVMERAAAAARRCCTGAAFEALVDAVAGRSLDPYAAARSIEGV